MNITWSCHVCGDERPDENIDVYFKHGQIEGRIPYTQNIRYCNDRAACMKGAPDVDFMPTRSSE